MQLTKHKLAGLTIVIVAVVGFAFFAPVIGGIPASQLHKCEVANSFGCTFAETYSSTTYYYLGYGGAYYPISTPSYRIYT
jgi:hypothetical protein